MMYKTIVLEMIQEQPELYEDFRGKKMLLPAIEAYAADLMTSHRQWQEQLRRQNPGSDPRQITAEAMELAIQDLLGHFPSASPKDDMNLTLDAAMSYLRPHTPPE